MQEVSVADQRFSCVTLLCDNWTSCFGFKRRESGGFFSLWIHSRLGLSHRRFTPTGSSDSTRLIWLVCMFESDGCIIHLLSPSAFSNAFDRFFNRVLYKANGFRKPSRHFIRLSYCLCLSFFLFFLRATRWRSENTEAATRQEGCGFNSGAWGLSLWSLHILRVSVWVLSRFTCPSCTLWQLEVTPVTLSAGRNGYWRWMDESSFQSISSLEWQVSYSQQKTRQTPTCYFCMAAYTVPCHL